MRSLLAVHIVAGGLGLVTGYIALFSAKGAAVHRRSGMLFVSAMLTMAIVAFVLAAGRGVAPRINIPAALLTACMVVTGFAAVRPRTEASRRLDVVMMLVTLAVGLACLGIGLQLLAVPGGRRGAVGPLLMFGVVGLLAVAGDVRMIRAGGVTGAARLARHLWRMCFSLLVAAMSFFLGQAKLMPEAIRTPMLLALPVLLVLGTMVYWMWRMRRRRPANPVSRIAVAEAV
jgi:hypothetical protein